MPVDPAPAPPRVAAVDEGGWGSGFARRHRRLTVLTVLVVVLLLVAAVAVAVGLLGEARQDSDDRAAARCAGSRTVRVVVDPTLASTLRRVAAEQSGTPLSTGVCAEVDVLAQPSAQTASRLGDDPRAATAYGLPDLWVPDSSVWLGRAVADPPRDDVTLTDLGSFVSSPLVVAASPEVADSTGWAAAGPSWAQVLGSGRPVALPDLAGSAAGIHVLLALQASVGEGQARRDALGTAAAAVRLGTVTDPAAAFALLDAGGEDAPLVPTSEQQVFQESRGSISTPAVAVRPTGPRTSLDYPVVRVDTPQRRAGADAAAVEGVVRLLEGAGRDAAVLDGFRGPERGAAQPSTGPTPDPSAGPLVPAPRWSDVEVLVRQLEELGRPARVLAVLDATASMRAVTGTGATRAEVAQDAVTVAVGQLPDASSMGLWFFGADLGRDAGGEQTDHVEVVPLRPLDPALAGLDQRSELAAGAATLPLRLTPGRTGLFDTVLAAVRSVREGYDPEAVTTVVVVTDGAQDDPGAPGLDELVATLRAEADPAQPVRVVTIGLSGDVDPAELRAVAEATGGAAYLAEQPEDLATVLADALQRR